MGFGVGHPDLAVYRLVKGGETGLNLRLSDLFDKEIEFPSLIEVIRSILRGSRLKIKIKAFPNAMIERLQNIQLGVDKEIKRKVEEAKRAGK